MKRVLSLALALLFVITGVLMTACSDNEDKKLGESDPLLAEVELKKDFEIPADFKIGVILLHDEDSTYDLNFINAIKRVQKALGLSDEQVILKRNIEESNACYEAAKELVEKGCKIVFADSFGHESFMVAAAKELAEDFPDVQFCHATGTTAHTEKLDNFHNAFASIYEGRYLAGIAAGLKLNELKEAGKLKGDVPMMGYVGAYTYAEVISGYTSFYLGAKSVCPDVQMKVQFTGSWYNEKEEKSAAQALIDAGCDLISQHADSMGAPTACEDAGIPNVSYNGSTYEAGENTFIISSRIDWAPYYLYIIKSYCTGAKIATDWTGTIETGSVLLTGLNQDVAAKGTKEAIDKAVADLKSGKLHVFDTAKANFITIGGKAVTSYLVEEDNEVVKDGYFHESEFRSAPYFDARIDGITLVNEKY